jgi:hypothetical protein
MQYWHRIEELTSSNHHFYHNTLCQGRMLCSVFHNTNLAKICRKPDTPSLSQRTNQTCMVEKQLYAAPGNRNRAETKFKELL